MEKFTVDLDKVLDEFEFNEEQAVRHALQNFKREDLPASKYQKPHFRPINIAEADFGPCIETTMSYSSYHHKHSQNATNSLMEPNGTSLNYKKSNDVKHPVIADFIKAPLFKNCHTETDSYRISSNENENEVDVEKPLKDDGINNITTTQVFEEEKFKYENKKNSINQNNVVEKSMELLEVLGKQKNIRDKKIQLNQTEMLVNDVIEEEEKRKNIEVEEKLKILAEKKRMEDQEKVKRLEEKKKILEEKEEIKRFQEEEKRLKKEEKEKRLEDEEERKRLEEEKSKRKLEEEKMGKNMKNEEKIKEIEEEESQKRNAEKKSETIPEILNEEKKVIIPEENRSFLQGNDSVKLMEKTEVNDTVEMGKNEQVKEVEEKEVIKEEVAQCNEKKEFQFNEENSDKSFLTKDINQDEVKKSTELPDWSKVSQENTFEETSSEVKNLNVIRVENTPKETETAPESIAYITEIITETKSKETPAAKVPVDEVEIIKEEIKPIQFETQLDITDEELQRYLEELEEEEEEELRRKESESKPVRPDSLNLNYKSDSKETGSPGLTPLPRNSEGSEGVRLEEENLKNGSTEGASEKTKMDIKENIDSLEELEDLIEASSAPTCSEFPLTIDERRLGKVSPFWMPDHLASSCMECDSKFTVIKRRHHCRACGRILCSKCCGMRASLEYLQNQEQKVCETCFRTLAKVMMYELQSDSESESSPRRRPNPNNPMEYCSTVPPPLQISSSSTQPPSVLVPVLKREGSSKIKEAPKQVMFSDGIRPGGDLTELDGSGDQRNTSRKPARGSKRAGTPPGSSLSPSIMLPSIDPVSQSFILEKGLPPVFVVNKGETTYEENWPLSKIMERLRDPDSPPLQFAINRNLSASVKITKLDCCMKETCWVICSKGMGCVGQDEIMVLLTLSSDEDDKIPKEVLLQFHYIYQEASKGNTVNELGYWCVKESTFLDSKQHGGFLFIRPTFQCLNRIEIPPPPFLVGILIHRSEIPWARVFPFRLMLRLGAEFRYYPCPLVSVRFREPVYYEIGHTIINLLADFRNLSYTIPSVRGLRIHMEANQTSILIPRNRYDQVIRALNNSNDPVLALAGNFSPEADAHLVCMQSKGNEVTYSTHAININDKPRKVTGASFVVLNGALKTVSGVAAKSSIVEDGLMVQVPSETMTALRTKLRNMEDWSVRCGPIEGRNAEEVVKIIWCEDDKNFNIGVKSVIDNMPLDGVPSIRVHSGKDYMGCTKFIRWTQVFIIKCEDGATSAKIGDPLEVNKVSENIARATCLALTKLLELLAASGLTVLAVRATIDQDNVGYEAGSNGEKLAPIYMNSLDNELIPVLHKAASVNDSVAVLELIFHIMDQ